MAINDTASITTQGAYVQVDGTYIAAATGFPGLESGSAPDIDITTLRSGGREFRTGFRDPGTASIPLIAQPQSPVESVLATAADNGTQHQFTFRVGGKIDSDTGYVENEAEEIDSDLGAYTATHAGTEATLTFAGLAGSMPGITPGDYIEIDGDDYKVNSATIGTNNAGVVKVAASAAPTAYSAGVTVAKLLRPGYKVEMTGSVQSFSFDVNPDDVARRTLTIRLSGKPTRTVGSPDLS